MTRFLKQELEKKILCMGGAEFQELCDSLLFHIYRDKLTVYNRVGHQIGKSKTIAGTPDTFFLLGQNGIVFMEATTKADDIYSKLAGDIASCLEKNKIDLGDYNIKKIILCYNNRIDIELELKLLATVDKNLEIEHYSIDRIVEIILNDQPWLADTLGININKPGILSLEKFIEKYNITALKFSSPLNSKFVSRENELSQISDMLQQKDILLVSGEPGVGKTRLVVEYLKTCFADRRTNIIVIDENAINIESSILPILSNEQETIIFVDDVNRKPLLLDTLLSLQSSNKYRVKIILTIRGYLFHEFVKSYPLIKEQTFHLNPLPENCIKEILESEPYGIRNLIFQERIENIAQGNVRIAIMCAELAVKKNGLNNLIKDVPSLYDAYFSDYINKLTEKEYRVLCACAVFRCLKQGNEDTESILRFCKIDRETLESSIALLEENECVNIWTYDDGKAIKVVDQVFSTYLVYNSVFVKKIYSLDDILDVFFHSYKRTIIDSIGGVLTSYDYSIVGETLSESANKYADKIRANDELYQEAIDTFGFYMPEKALEFYDSMVSCLPIKDNPSFTTDYKLNDFSYKQDHIITQLVQYFHHEYDHSNLAFEILYDYCNRCPEKLPELVYWIRKNVLYTKYDYLHGLCGLQNFVEHLFTCMSRYSCCIPLFFAISKTMLEYSFSTDTMRGRNFVLNHYTLCKSDCVVAVRKKIIEKLKDLNSEYHYQVINVLLSYKICHEDCALSLVKTDIENLCSVVPEICSPCIFRDVLAVNHLCHFSESILGTKDTGVAQLIKEYKTDKYVRYKSLAFDKIRGVHTYDIDNIWDAKRCELQDYFLLKNQSDVQNLITELKEFSEHWDSNRVYESIILIVALNIANDYTIGQLLFVSILETFPDIATKGSWGFVFHEVWQMGYYSQMLNTIVEYKGTYKFSLLFNYCYYLTYQTAQKVEQIFCDSLKVALEHIDYYTQIQLDSLVKFGNVAEYLMIIEEHNNNSTVKIRIHSNGFCNKVYFSDDINLAIRTYKQQNSIDPHFDYENEIVSWLYKWSPESFVGILDYLLENDSEQSLSFVFSGEYSFEYVKSLIEKLSNRQYRYKRLTVRNLFMEINDNETRHNALKFIKRYIDLFIDDQEAISIIIDASRCLGIETHDDFLLFYLNNYPSDQSIDKFDFWTDHSASYGGNTTYGDIMENRWNAILKVATKVSDLRRRNRIIRVIKEQLECARRSSYRERGERFMRD